MKEQHMLAANTAGVATHGRRNYLIALGIMVVAMIAAPFVLYPVFLMKVLAFALFACGFNLLFGYTGIMSFGHAAFFGTGSYVVAWTMNRWGLTPEVALLAALAGGAEAVTLADLLPGRWASFIRSGDVEDVRPLGVVPGSLGGNAPYGVP